MSFNAAELLLAAFGYLSLLFLLAYATERGFIPRRWSHHPLVYVLSLGVYSGVWAVYGSVGMAYQYGYGYLAYYLGICGAFLLAPVLLHPILRITRAYQLTSLADLFAFRYRSQWAGTLVAVATGASVMALIGLQIKAVTDSLSILAPDAPTSEVSILFSATIVLFAVLFGARRDQGQESHEGLVMAIAFDSVVKVVTMLILGGVVLYAVFGGPSGLNDWLTTQAPRVSALERRLGDGGWRALLLMSFATALVMPHMFHVTFTENANPRSLAKASWGLPLYLLLLAIPVPILLWGGIEASIPTDPNFFALGAGLTLSRPWLVVLIYIAGTSAASGLMIVVTLGLAGMLLNHIVLPLRPPREQTDIYSWLRWVKRLLIAIIILAAWLFNRSVGHRLDLDVLGVLAFSGVLQLLPGALGVIYWPEGNRKGVIAGLLTGLGFWLTTLVLPLLFKINALQDLGITVLQLSDQRTWATSVFTSLAANIAVFALVSLITRVSREEASAAQACSLGALSRPQRRELIAASSEDFKQQLSIPLGPQVAEREVGRALQALQLPNVEYRPYQLRRLRDQIEIGLSGLLGPGVAQDIVKRHLGYKPLAGSDPAQDIHYVERALEDYQTRLTGLAAELDNLRRHYRQTLQNLPIGACSIGNDGEILMWNQALQDLTGIAAEQAVGSHLTALTPPWNELLPEFAEGEEIRLYKQRTLLQGRAHWLSLHKSLLGGPDHPEDGMVILIEDQTETRLLEDELIHSERLASVGRLAAGVAHEIGNPVTGIACLAQNLQLETDDEEILGSAAQILQQTRRISGILQSLMNFSRSGNHAQANRYEPANVHRCIQEAINLLTLSDKPERIHYENLCPTDLLVVGDEQRLVQVFVNLLGNARDASPEGAHVRVGGNRDGYSAIIEVSDEGCGIPADQLDHIFEPFYTTKGPQEGTGLGLSLVYSIVEEHYGNIQVESPLDPETGRGTRFVLRLPAYQDDADNTASQEDREAST